MAHAHAEISTDNYAVTLKAGAHALVSDEPERLGGKDAGPAPYELLVSALAACTAITLRMYAQRKRWPLIGIELDVEYRNDDGLAAIARRISLKGDLSQEQRTRLAEIAEKTPVTRTLKAGAAIHTTFI